MRWLRCSLIRKNNTLCMKWLLPLLTLATLLGCENIKYKTSITLTCDPEDSSCDRYNVFNYAASVTADWPKYPFYTRDEYIYLRHQPSSAKTNLHDYIIQKQEANQKWNRFVYCVLGQPDCVEPITLEKNWLTRK